MTAADYSEDVLVEQPAIALFAELGWQTANGRHESFAPGGGSLGRETKAEVILLPRLRAALARLNPHLPPAALEQAVEQITRDRSAMSLAHANREIYRLLKDGAKVTVRAAGQDAGGRHDEERTETVRVVDWRDPAHNDFLLASQFWVAGEMYTRRADLVGFVNGLPLVFVELKASHKNVQDAYAHNLKDYKSTVPHLFWPNALIVLSNGSESRLGSVTAAWEHFAEWKKVESEAEPGAISLETMLRGTCRPARLLDLVENFTLFDEGKGALVKLLAKNHQVLGVNNAIREVRRLPENGGRLGVFWHTQGSGKSVSMLFFAQKVLRTLPGNWTFVVVTDRDELDDQIYKQFVSAGALAELKTQATSAEHLRQLLREDHRYVFTLIQKFRTAPGETHPILSTRADVVVMTDEAHRSQYDVFAANMRAALPHAAFIGFTGTPLMKEGEERTREVFGDYVSVYNFRQSIIDGATVPLYYENRIPELQLTNDRLNEDMEELLEAAELDEEQQKKLEREFAREYHLITRDDRLEKIAEDLVAHFMGRGHQGKAMVICIDKATAVRMYDKVRKHWRAYLDTRRGELLTAPDAQQAALRATIAYMERLDMAVVVSQGQNEVEEMRARGLDITPHRKRMLAEDLDAKFKDPDDPFAIVFVCAMWMTGFDVPSCSTIYLDKPMRNHTLMQTIARANRVAEGKVAGLIVDYVGVFRNLQQALAIYGGATGTDDGESPVQSKSELVAWLTEALAEAEAFCTAHGVDLAAVQSAQGFARIKLLDDAVEALVSSDETRRRYLAHAANSSRLYKAILPDPLADSFRPTCVLLAVVAEKIRSRSPRPDISRVMADVDDLLNDSVAAEGYVIRELTAAYETGGAGNGAAPPHLVDLSRIDFEALKALFETGKRHTAAFQLRGQIAEKLTSLVRLNKLRLDYLAKFQQMIDEYNAGSANVEEFFGRLVAFAQQLDAEEQRGISEGLSEEELALFDLLTRPEMTLSKQEEAAVKKVAKNLLATLKTEKLVLEWRRKQQARAAVQLCIEEALDQLPAVYTPDLFRQKCDATYQHVYESYFGNNRSIYSPSP